MLVMQSPTRLGSDHGRVINNALPERPETLCGEADELYRIWLEKAKPLGHRLKAVILALPDDPPGDVGLFLNWDDPMAR